MQPPPILSLVVGSHNARTSIRECLASLSSQVRSAAIEIIVVDNSTDGTSRIIRDEFPGVHLINAPPSGLIPELWGLGISRSLGEIVAITTAHCVPAPDWIEALLRAHAKGHQAIGGAIENCEGAGPVDWAIFFCRYSPYMLPFEPARVWDFAGDNASYSRAALDVCGPAIHDGFWEPTAHEEMARHGIELLLTPDIVVVHKHSFTFAGFLHQRLRHGREFGSARARKFSRLRRFLYASLSPLIPAIFLTRITLRVARKRRHLLRFLLATPALTLFLVGWALGEMSGYVRPVAPARAVSDRERVARGDGP